MLWRGFASAGVRGARCVGLARRGLASEAAAAATDKLRLNFVVPHKPIKNNELVDMVVVPGASGVMGILPQHAPTVAQLRPGVVAIQYGDRTERYFVSSGFAFIHTDRADVCAVEAIPVEDIDPAAVSKGLSECEATASSAANELAKAEAQIGIDVYHAMQAAITEK